MGVARERKIKIEGVTVRVANKPNVAVKGPHDPKQRTLKMVELRRHIEVEGAISEEEAEILLWGAKNCPISNTIKRGVPIVTRLVVVRRS